MNYNYDQQVKRFIEIMKAGETPRNQFSIGAEFEHFIIRREDGRTVAYLGEDGIESLMKALLQQGWTAHDEGGHLLTITKEDMTITTEPGAQLEFSMTPKRSLKEMENTYERFEKELLPILESRGQWAVSMGYHPKTKIEEISLLPKERYHNMFEYFKSHGSRSHNMMKGTCALQIAIDYESEEDYRKKFHVANKLSNVFYAMFENAFFFEGEPTDMHNMRAYIWQHTDHDRSGLVEGALDANFSYEQYAHYLLERPAIYAYQQGELTFTGDTLIKDIVDPETATDEELFHLMTMFFPDVRTKNFIEIRMFDAVPFPLNFAAIALVKGLFYHEENLNILYKRCQDMDVQEVIRARGQLYEQGLHAVQCGHSIGIGALELITMAKQGLEPEEQGYLEPLQKMISQGLNPYLITKHRYEKGFYEAIKWCILGRETEFHLERRDYESVDTRFY